jgi:hypothetical protein
MHLANVRLGNRVSISTLGALVPTGFAGLGFVAFRLELTALVAGLGRPRILLFRSNRRGVDAVEGLIRLVV